MRVRHYLALLPLLTLLTAPAYAGFIDDMLKREALKQLAKQFGQEAPTISSADAVFPTVPTPPGQAFTPRTAPPSVWTQLATTPDGSVKLAPGDYQFKVWSCCLKQHNAHSPAGHLYILAPIKGKRAAMITALNARAAAASVPGWQTQHLSWDMQAGLHYDQLPENEQAIVDKYLSDYKDSLSGSQLDRVKGTYDKYAPKIHWPRFDQALSGGQLGDVGKSVLELEQFQTLLLNSNSAAGVSSLIDRAPSDATGGAANTPWSQVNDRVYERIYTAGTAEGYATLQTRVLPDASSNDAAGQPADVPISSLEGEPQNDHIQPLSIQPVKDDQPQPTAEQPQATITLIKATTTDAQSVTVDYSVSQAATNPPAASQQPATPNPSIDFKIYRSANPTVAETGSLQTPSRQVLIGEQSVTDSQAQHLANGNSEITLISGTELPPDTAMPYVVVTASCGGQESTTYFKKWLLGVVVHGFDPYAYYFGTLGTATPDWELQTAVSLKLKDHYDAVIPFNWETICAVATPGMTARAGNELFSAICSNPIVMDDATKHLGDVVDVHLIGHSRGTVVISQTLLDFQNRMPLDLQGSYVAVTLLDPHPANNTYGSWCYAAPLHLGRLMYKHTQSFQAAAHDPRIAIPKGIKRLEIFYQKSGRTHLSGFEEDMNLWGMIEALDNLSAIPPQWHELTSLDFSKGVTIGHGEVPLYYLENVVKSGTLNHSTAP